MSNQIKSTRLLDYLLLFNFIFVTECGIGVKHFRGEIVAVVAAAGFNGDSGSNNTLVITINCFYFYDFPTSKFQTALVSLFIGFVRLVVCARANIKLNRQQQNGLECYAAQFGVITARVNLELVRWRVWQFTSACLRSDVWSSIRWRGVAWHDTDGTLWLPSTQIFRFCLSRTEIYLSKYFPFTRFIAIRLSNGSCDCFD